MRSKASKKAIVARRAALALPSGSGSAEAKEDFAKIESSVEERARKLTEERQRQKDARDAEEWKLRRNLARGIIWVFLLANFWAVISIGVSWYFDYKNSLVDPNHFEHRIFDKEVIIALLAAVTVQLGVVATVVSRWLYK